MSAKKTTKTKSKSSTFKPGWFVIFDNSECYRELAHFDSLAELEASDLYLDGYEFHRITESFEVKTKTTSKLTPFQLVVHEEENSSRTKSYRK